MNSKDKSYISEDIIRHLSKHNEYFHYKPTLLVEYKYCPTCYRYGMMPMITLDKSTYETKDGISKCNRKITYRCLGCLNEFE
jgi:hypothetical protein